MKKINKNIFVFIFVFIIISCGFFSKKYLVSIYSSLCDFVSNIATEGIVNSFVSLTDNVESISTEQLSYHDSCMDVSSVFSNVVNFKIIKKDDMTVVKTENDYLIQPSSNIDDDTLDSYVNNIKELYLCALENDSDFLYIAAPEKGYYFKTPNNVKSFTKSNFDRYIEALDENNIPYLNLIEKAKEDKIAAENMFFVTDHHWKPTLGIWACEKTCETLNDYYGFEYNSKYNDLSNYNVEMYEDWFLGSYGKKVGTYFTPFGADDFDLITPTFETDLTEEQPIKNEVRTGDFSETVLFKNNLETKDYYKYNPYATYSGGDFRLQIITNNLNPNGETFLVVRDSFACVVTPFLSLNSSKIYNVDIRDYEYYVGDRVNISEYIREIKPDNVLVLYSGVSSGDSNDRYNFN